MAISSHVLPSNRVPSRINTSGHMSCHLISHLVLFHLISSPPIQATSAHPMPPMAFLISLSHIISRRPIAWEVISHHLFSAPISSFLHSTHLIWRHPMSFHLVQPRPILCNLPCLLQVVSFNFRLITTSSDVSEVHSVLFHVVLSHCMTSLPKSSSQISSYFTLSRHV